MKNNINEFLNWSYSRNYVLGDRTRQYNACREFYYYACRKDKLLLNMMLRIYQAQLDPSSAHETLLWLMSMREQIYESLFLLIEKCYGPDHRTLNWKEFLDAHQDRDARTFRGRIMMEYAYGIVQDTPDFKNSLYAKLEVLRNNLINNNRTSITLDVPKSNDLPAVYASLCQRYLWLVMRFFVEARIKCQIQDKADAKGMPLLHRLGSPVTRFYRYSWKARWGQLAWERHHRIHHIYHILRLKNSTFWHVAPRVLFVIVVIEIILGLGLPVIDKMLPGSHSGFFTFLQGQNRLFQDMTIGLVASLCKFLLFCITTVVPWLGKAIGVVGNCIFTVLGWLLEFLFILIRWLFDFVVWLFNLIIGIF